MLFQSDVVSIKCRFDQLSGHDFNQYCFSLSIFISLYCFFAFVFVGTVKKIEINNQSEHLMLYILFIKTFLLLKLVDYLTACLPI